MLLHLRQILLEVPREHVETVLPELCLPGYFRPYSRRLVLQLPLHPHVRFFSRLILFRYALRDTGLESLHFFLLLREKFFSSPSLIFNLCSNLNKLFLDDPKLLLSDLPRILHPIPHYLHTCLHPLVLGLLLGGHGLLQVGETLTQLLDPLG